MAELAALDPLEVRRLCHALLLGEGLTVEDYRTTAEYYEFSTSVVSGWRARRMIARIFRRPVGGSDLDRALVDAQIAGAAEALVVAPKGIAGSVHPPLGVHLVPPEELAARITSSPLVSWRGGSPAAAVERLSLRLDLAERTALLDPVGIQWLPALALNELPPELATHDVEPQDLLERKAFRLLTATFRFGGTRYGEAVRGKRYPDAVLVWPDGSGKAGMLDCKAASAGYQMEADHLLRFIRYWDTLYPDLAAVGIDLQYLVVLSSFFPGTPGDKHPFYGRAGEIRDKTGLGLAYISASDLAWAASEVEAKEIPLERRASIDWCAILDAGLVSTDELSRGIGT